MVRERKAFSTDTVKTILPDKALDTSHSLRAQDYSSQIEARMQGSGMELMPHIVDAVTEGGKIVSDVYRSERHWDNYIQKEWDSKLVALDDKEEQTILQQQQNNKAFDTLLDMNLRTEEAYRKAINSGDPDILGQMQPVLEENRRMADSLFSQSPYLAQRVSAGLYEIEKDYSLKGAKDTFDIAQKQTEYKINFAANFMNDLTGTKYGIGADSVLGTTYDWLNHNQVGSLIFSMTEQEGREQFLNEVYNKSIVLRKVDEIETAVALGRMSVKDGKNAILDIANRAAKGTWEVTDADGNKHNVTLYITPEVNAQIRGAAISLSDGGASVKSLNASKDYIAPFKSGDTINFENLLNTPIEVQKGIYKNSIGMLENEAKNGNVKAYKEAGELTWNHYTLVEPSTTVFTSARAAANKGMLEDYISDLRKTVSVIRQNALAGKLKQEDLGISYSNPEAGLTFSIAFPGESNSYLAKYAEDIGTSPELLTRKGVLEMCDNIDKVLDYCETHEADLKNPNAIKEYDIVSQRSLTQVTDKGVLSDPEGAADWEKSLTKIMETEKAYPTPQGYSNSSLDTLIKGAAKSTKGYSPIRRSMEAGELAKVAIKTGAAPILLRAGSVPENFSEDELSFYTDVCARIRAQQAGAKYDLLIQEGLKANKVVDDPNDLVSVLKQNRNITSINSTEVIDSLGDVYNDYNVPSESRPHMTKAICQVVAGAAMSGTGEINGSYIRNVARQMVSSSFTKKGTDKVWFPKGDEKDKQLDLQNSRINKRLTNIGGGDISASVNAYSDNIDILQRDFDLDRYYPMTFSNVAGQSLPLRVYSSATGGEEATDTLVLVGGVIATTADAPLDPELTKTRHGKKLNMSVMDISAVSSTLAGSFIDKKNQESYREWVASNYTSEVLTTSAPKDFVRLVLEKGRRAKETGWNDEESIRVENAINYFWAKAQGGALSVTLDNESKGIYMQDVTTAFIPAFEKHGIKFTATAEKSGHAVNSLHYKGKAVDIGARSELGGWYGVFVTGRDNKVNHLKKEVFDDIGKPTLAMAKMGIVDRVVTNRPELVEGLNDPRSKDKDFEIYRKAKNAKGEPLFVWDPKMQHLDHFHMEFTQTEFSIDSGEEIREEENQYLNRAIPVIKSNVGASGRYMLNDDEARAIAIHGSKYKVTEADLKRMGWDSTEMANAHPMARAVAYGMRYAELKNILGSSEKAIEAMWGATFKIGSDDDFISKMTGKAGKSSNIKMQKIKAEQILAHPVEIKRLLDEEGFFIEIDDSNMTAQERGGLEAYKSKFRVKRK